MKKNLLWLWYWLPPLLLMLIIYLLSSQPSVQVSSNEAEDFAAHKFVHIIEYGILTFLIFRGIYFSFKHSLSLNQQLAVTALCTLLYALTDEIHQTFIPTRTGRLRDIFIDIIGISIVVLYTRYQSKKVKKILF